MVWKMLIIVISSVLSTHEKREERTSPWFARKNRKNSHHTHVDAAAAANEKNDLDDELTDFLAVAKRAML